MATSITPTGPIVVEQPNPALLQTTATIGGTVSVCSAQCTPLLVASANVGATGSTAVNVIASGPIRIHSFVVAGSSSGSVSFYDVVGTDPAPTNSDAPAMVVGLGASAAIVSPSFPTGTYHEFANGLWIRTNTTFNPTTTGTLGGRITVWYTTP